MSTPVTQLIDAFKAKIDAWNAAKEIEARQAESRWNIAKVFLEHGFTLIPSSHLSDRQIVVSEGVYEAAKSITARRIGE